ncbi:hypothetical protein GF327_08605 [Candidatus Woesearchaeota archaeon]|nr:hypothetical protein [Candidatus Woesearchaeota archaeon]
MSTQEEFNSFSQQVNSLEQVIRKAKGDFFKQEDRVLEACLQAIKSDYKETQSLKTNTQFPDSSELHYRFYQRIKEHLLNYTQEKQNIISLLHWYKQEGGVVPNFDASDNSQLSYVIGNAIAHSVFNSSDRSSLEFNPFDVLEKRVGNLSGEKTGFAQDIDKKAFWKGFCQRIFGINEIQTRIYDSIKQDLSEDEITEQEIKELLSFNPEISQDTISRALSVHFGDSFNSLTRNNSGYKLSLSLKKCSSSSYEELPDICLDLDQEYCISSGIEVSYKRTFKRSKKQDRLDLIQQIFNQLCMPGQIIDKQEEVRYAADLVVDSNENRFYLNQDFKKSGSLDTEKITEFAQDKIYDPDNTFESIYVSQAGGEDKFIEIKQPFGRKTVELILNYRLRKGQKLDLYSMHANV